MSRAMKRILGLCGLPGAGKTVVASLLAGLGHPVVTMGDAIRDLAKERGLPITRDNLAALMTDIRRAEGEGAVAKHCMHKVRALNSPVVVVDGLRSLKEVEEFKKFFHIFTVAILSSRETRFRRLSARSREDDPTLFEELVKRDEKELALGLDRLMVLSNFFLVNEGTKEHLLEEVKAVLERTGVE